MPTKRTRPDGSIYYEGSYQNKKLGIPRARECFDTLKEAKAWEREQAKNSKSVRQGNRTRRLFGEALIEYLNKETPQKKTRGQDTDLYIANCLRWPFKYDGRFFRLEELPLEPNPNNPDALWIVTGLTQYIYDLKQIEKRGYLGSQHYHKIGGTWYHQPDPNEGTAPAARRKVTDPNLIKALDNSKGRGPYDSGTLRRRQAFVSSILAAAYRKWQWVGKNWNDMIVFEKPSRKLKEWARYEQLLALLCAAEVGFDQAILGAVLLGWRKSNQMDLDWQHIQLPVYEEVNGQRRMIQSGVAVAEGSETKNSEAHVTPISIHLEDLLEMRHEEKRGDLVFHRGDGKPWGEFRKRWRTTIKQANAFLKQEGLPLMAENFRWHSLRRTFASYLYQRGADRKMIQQLGNWKDERTMLDYSQLGVDHLLDVANQPITRR